MSETRQQAHAVAQVVLEQSAQLLVLSNGYVRVEFDLTHPRIAGVSAYFTGLGSYGGNLVTDEQGIVLERYDAISSEQQQANSSVDGSSRERSRRHASSAGAASEVGVAILEDSLAKVVVCISGVVDDVGDPLLSADWTLSLAAGERFFTLDIVARALRTAPVASICIAGYFTPASVYGLFERGVMQRMDSPLPCFASTDLLHRYYALDGNGCLDIVAPGPYETLLLNAPEASQHGYRSGFQQVLAGSYPIHDRWSEQLWEQAQPLVISAGQRWATRLRVAGNNYAFPVSHIPVACAMSFEDLRTFYTAIYATSVGSLVSYEFLGEVSPTLAYPEHDYAPLFNFFDPDAWEGVCALVYSGDPYLQREARKLIETSGAAMLASGQIPHHFSEDQPLFTAISGATQTGPNIFWISAALQYAKSTGDYAWLRGYMPHIEQALTFLTERYDPEVKLVNAPGPLWIDVFIRHNYTADTNAYMVGLLRSVAEAEAFLGERELAERRRALAVDIVDGMNRHLWSEDHYITQLNPDGSTRDFVDYDANLLAIASGVASPEQAAAILARVDGGPCTHARATFVSERYYGPEDTYNGNVGDSDITMARIAWADGHARAVMGDIETFKQRIINPLRADMFATTWLYERYDCQGREAHNPFYHEYPEILVMLLREVSFGINLHFGTVVIRPSGRTRFHYHVGNLQVDYAPEAIAILLPECGERQFSIASLPPNSQYQVNGQGLDCVVATDAEGVLSFTAPTTTCVTATLLDVPRY